jgi:tetratricopeptide (TPR) repeat protein
MSQILRDRIRKKLHEAEGYLMLELPRQALEILETRSEWETMQFEASFLRGEALRALQRHREAIPPLETAASLRPGDVGVALALGWCYKRTNRLAQAIDALDRALVHEPDNPLLHYNLACYWSLAGNAGRALAELRSALKLNPDLRTTIVGEPDFAKLRGLPEFDHLVEGSAPIL